MTEDAPDLQTIAKYHPGVWMEYFARILTKIRAFERPVLNIFQARVVAAYVWCIVHGIAPRIIGLKPRQVGGTTVFAAVSYHHGRRFNSKGIVIADVLEKSGNLFRMLSDFAKYDELDWGFPAAGVTQTRLSLGNGTEFVKRSADVPTASRGDTITIADMSEVAFWKDTSVKSAAAVAASILNALADHPETFGGMESTPNGATGMFYEQWQSARWPDFDDYWKKYSTQTEEESSGWLRVFAAWFEFPEHRESVRRRRPLTPEEVEKIMSNLSEWERIGVAKYGWNADQIAWARWTKKNKCLNDQNRFDEEYPSDPQTCFLSSGRPRFDTGGVAEIEIRSRSIRPEMGILVRQSGGAVTFQATAENEAWCQIWEKPRIGCKYLISIDTMRGESETARSADSDAHSILVWRAAYQDSEGTLHHPRLAARITPPCRLDNKPAAQQVDLLSWFFGRCIVAIEINNGIGMLVELRALGVPLYRMQTWDKQKQAPVTTLGWETNPDTRGMIIDELADRIRSRTIDIACPWFSSQCQTFIINNKGKAEAQAGKKDDDVLSGAIGVFCIDSATEYQQREIEPQLPEDWDRWKPV